MVIHVKPYLLEVQIYNRDEVQGMRIMVVVWATVARIHPQLDESPLAWYHVDCNHNPQLVSNLVDKHASF